jgi:hypothetical protein
MAVQLVTGSVLALTGAFPAFSYRFPLLLIPGLGCAAACVICWLRTPIAYEISNRTLIVRFRLGSKEFGPITDCKPVPEKIGFSLRLWGNGGLFSCAGCYWNRRWGLFRMYSTTFDRTAQLLVETETHKVVVSPKDTALFIQDATASR